VPPVRLLGQYLQPCDFRQRPASNSASQRCFRDHKLDRRGTVGLGDLDCGVFHWIQLATSLRRLHVRGEPQAVDRTCALLAGLRQGYRPHFRNKRCGWAACFHFGGCAAQVLPRTAASNRKSASHIHQSQHVGGAAGIQGSRMLTPLMETYRFHAVLQRYANDAKMFSGAHAQLEERGWRRASQ
jgi:hypothetical protein